MSQVATHETFLAHRGFLYLKIALVLSILSIVLYLVLDYPAGHNGGTWLGYGLGTVGALLIVWLMWFGMRKRSYGAGNWSLKGWLSAHVYLGLSLIIVATLHTRLPARLEHPQPRLHPHADRHPLGCRRAGGLCPRADDD